MDTKIEPAAVRSSQESTYIIIPEGGCYPFLRCVEPLHFPCCLRRGLHLAVGIEDGREIVGDVELADDHFVQKVVEFVHRLEKVLNRRLQVGELFLILQKLVVLCLRKNAN